MCISTLQRSALALLLASCAPAAALSAQYTTFDVAGASGTEADGINAVGTVAGTYLDSSYHYHGFVRTADGSITKFDAPGGATVMNTRTLNRSGMVIGWY